MAIPPECLILCKLLRVGDLRVKTVVLKDLSEAEWQAVLRQADRHGLTPLLWVTVAGTGLHSQLPHGILARLRGSYCYTIRTNTVIYNELSRVLAALSVADIPTVVLKGGYLAEAIYGNIAKRPMQDIDLLIRENDLLPAIEALKLLGYQPTGHISIEALRRTVSHHLPPFSGPGGVTVEIHRSISCPNDPFRFDIDGLWERRRPVNIAGVRTNALCPEDLLLHVCYHAAYHHRFDFGLRPFCDICEILHHFRNEIDWKQCIARIQGARGIYLTLLLAHELLGAEAPEAILEIAGDIAGEPDYLQTAKELLLTEPGFVSANLARLCKDPSTAKRMRTLWRAFFPPIQVMLSIYDIHPALVFYWYPVRMMDVLTRHGGSLMGYLRHKEEALASMSRQSVQNRLIDWMNAETRPDAGKPIKERYKTIGT